MQLQIGLSKGNISFIYGNLMYSCLSRERRSCVKDQLPCRHIFKEDLNGILKLLTFANGVRKYNSNKWELRSVK